MAHAVIRVMVASAGTGEGKTTIGLALARLLSRTHRVAPFKIGPDYIDARLYEAACGVRARNLDLWLDGAEGVRANADVDADVALMESMMGLFDGDVAGETSSAHVASLLSARVIIVLDLWRMSQTAAAIALGLASARPRVDVAGVVLNRVGGPEHERSVRRALADVGIPVLAALAYRAEWSIPERLLGLDARLARVEDVSGELADALSSQIDVTELFGTPRLRGESRPAGDPLPDSRGPVIAVARDEAFWFTYPETLDALTRAGARVAFFSPVRDEPLPARTAAVWLSGGYPETSARELAAANRTRRSLLDAHASGVPIYAECGGLMYLLRELHTAEGVFAMSGAIDGAADLREPRLCIGYRRARSLHASLLDEANGAVRGYEYHYGSARSPSVPLYGFEDGTTEGVWGGALMASFVHRHLLPGDESVRRFVEACA